MESLRELTGKVGDTNLHIETITENVCERLVKQTEQICEMMVSEQSIVIGSKREQTSIITDDNSKTIISSKEECKIHLIKHTYRISRGIQSSSYTHSLIKQFKKVTRLKQITRDKGTHSKYRLNDNHNDKHNSYKNYKGYQKQRIKKPSRTVGQVSSLKRTNERERERERETFVRRGEAEENAFCRRLREKKF